MLESDLFEGLKIPFAGFDHGVADDNGTRALVTIAIGYGALWDVGRRPDGQRFAPPNDLRQRLGQRDELDNEMRWLARRAEAMKAVKACLDRIEHPRASTADVQKDRVQRFGSVLGSLSKSGCIETRSPATRIVSCRAAGFKAFDLIAATAPECEQLGEPHSRCQRSSVSGKAQEAMIPILLVGCQ